jgi:hypothetical protein
MLKNSTREDILNNLLTLIQKETELTDHEWDNIYLAVMEYPEESKLILEAANPVFYKTHFERFYAVMENEPLVYHKFKNIPQLINRIEDSEIDVTETSEFLGEENLARIHIEMKLHIKGNPALPFDVQLSSFVAGMELRSLSPLPGVVTGAPHVPYFAMPSITGYMSRKGILRQRGYRKLLDMIEDIRRVLLLITKHPDFALGLYTLCYYEIKKQDKDAEYGKLKTFAYFNEIMSWANNLSRKRYDAYTYYPGDFIASIQNVMNKHPEVFKISGN